MRKKKEWNESETKGESLYRIRVSIAPLVVIAISPFRARKMRIRAPLCNSLLLPLIQREVDGRKGKRTEAAEKGGRKKLGVGKRHYEKICRQSLAFLKTAFMSLL